MYEYTRKKRRISTFLIFFLFMVIFLILGFILYNMFYTNLENENSINYDAVRLSNNKETIKENTQDSDITNILEKSIKSVVGISKIKDAGNSIFLNNSTEELGLGSGIIISDNRIHFNELTCCRE